MTNQRGPATLFTRRVQRSSASKSGPGMIANPLAPTSPRLKSHAHVSAPSFPSPSDCLPSVPARLMFTIVLDRRSKWALKSFSWQARTIAPRLLPLFLDSVPVGGEERKTPCASGEKMNRRSESEQCDQSARAIPRSHTSADGENKRVVGCA